MSSRKKSLIHFRGHWDKQAVTDLFAAADRISQGVHSNCGQGKVAALVFFEASTRTRMSFETACAREGFHPLILDGKSGSSLEKGETLEDTVLNIAAMKPEVLVVRSGDDLDFARLDSQVSIPVVNAGWGSQGHPTQALLDAYTLWRHRHRMESEKILIVGDVRHSRVASSHIELAKILGYQIAFCGPAHFLPEGGQEKVFPRLQEGLEWATAVMALRVQKERHANVTVQEDYATMYGINQHNKKWLREDIIIMHPGPINRGVEMDDELIADPRSVILQQVTHGVDIRQALLQKIFAGGAS